MTAQSPGQRLATTESSELHISPLKDIRNQHGLTTLYDIFATSMGPEGHAKVIHNNCGGQVTVSSDCGRLLQSLSISKPIIKLVVAAIKEHVRLYCDAGLYAASLSLSLINEALKVDINQRLVSEVYDIALKECIDFMQSERFPSKLKVDVDNSNEIQRRLVENMYKSKPVCLLFGRDLDYICQLTLEGSRNSCANGASEVASSLVYVTLEGKPAQDSKLLPGVLYECPQIPTYRRKPLDIKYNSKGFISLALIQTSMAGDSEAFLDVTFEMTSDLDLSSAILTQLTKFIESAIAAGAGMLICQKVVHPALKKLLRQHGVFVLDRLGRELFNATRKLSGGTILDPFSSADMWNLTSFLGGVSHLMMNGRSYVHMKDVSYSDGTPIFYSSVYTVLLCHRTEQALQELRTVFERCQHVLRLTSREQSVLCGGGCWQTSLCQHLIEQTTDLVEEWADKLGCTELQMSQILQMFTVSLGKIPLLLDHTDPYCHLVDTKSGHHFVTDSVDNKKNPVICQCGAISYHSHHDIDYVYLGNIGRTIRRPSKMLQRRNAKAVNVVDAFLPVISALKTAVAVGGMVLGIQNYVQDVN